MLFNSLEFALFLPIVFILYWLVFNQSIKLRNLFIVGVSYLFYGWWDVRFLLLIGLTTSVSFISGILISRYPVKARWTSAFNILFNIGLLAYFKYSNFFCESFVESFRLLGIELSIRPLQIILPVGISFYTFQALSYTIDVYKKKIEPTRDIVAFFAYVSFFPQLVAGPIERATHLLPQFFSKTVFSYPMTVDGMRQILWGLFKKIVVADNCARWVDTVYSSYPEQSSLTLIITAMLFSIQIYCDFSGYSDVAIGTARLFGFNLMRNFNMPYFSRDIAEFWRRWHISLTTMFRDYVYIPLGGSRGSRRQNVRNTFIVFLLSGLWHGANYTFIFWGIFNAILFLPLLLLKKNRRYTSIPAEGKNLPSAGEFISMLITFILVTIGWIFFRSDSLEQAFNYLSIISHFESFDIIQKRNLLHLLLIVFVLLSGEWIQRDKEYVLQVDNLSLWQRYGIYYFLIFMCFWFSVPEDIPFIYFQF
ncbi:MBOAT family O-acyltransferase [uncultured Parabacteroides sp.]|uniref:MBOAT family O-acyltransferase n=1 Tax=uncultured Parabacteroides sp. TaxID=512312 RepID=UPI00259B0F01|nr:MBOAT family O-acyltransferase [uncultured Parabacteroides sp.]